MLVSLTSPLPETLFGFRAYPNQWGLGATNWGPMGADWAIGVPRLLWVGSLGISSRTDHPQKGLWSIYHIGIIFGIWHIASIWWFIRWFLRIGFEPLTLNHGRKHAASHAASRPCHTKYLTAWSFEVPPSIPPPSQNDTDRSKKHGTSPSLQGGYCRGLRNYPCYGCILLV